MKDLMTGHLQLIQAYHSVLLEGEGGRLDTERRPCETRAEMRVRQAGPQKREQQEEEILHERFQRGLSPTDTLVSPVKSSFRLVLQNHERMDLCCFKSPACGILLAQSSECRWPSDNP
ncbi:hypothetical protein MJG53_018850 [Ovis ammon polii x Ovis aries]|uniref:Uncharacterized protein n=1 Tax=Ovis ammon polii x Ovis aries TaxID=2918886 RepID=A0ACB9U3V8_9CETA|nr:hypothetical protein MJG53_018850 [Ovis ammon polii x Ovis aries]